MTNRLVKPQGYGAHGLMPWRNNEISQLDATIGASYDGYHGDSIIGPILASDGYWGMGNGVNVLFNGGSGLGGLPNATISTHITGTCSNTSNFFIGTAHFPGTSTITNLRVGSDAFNNPLLLTSTTSQTRWEPLRSVGAKTFGLSAQLYLMTGPRRGTIDFPSSSASTPLLMPIKPPNGSQLVNVVASFIAAPGHTGLPSTMPRLQLFRTDRNTDSQVSIASAFDTSPNTTAFELFHIITATLPFPEFIDKRRYLYHIGFQPESGTHALGGSDLAGIGWQVSTSSFDPTIRYQ